MFTRNTGSIGTRRLVAVGLTGALLAALVAIIGSMIVNTDIAHGAGSGGGCFSSTTAPVCTFKNHEAFSDFSSVSADQCIFTDVYVQPFESLTVPGRLASTSVFLAISQYDACTGFGLSFLDNFDPNTGMPVFNGTVEFGTTFLGTASINGSAPMYDAFSGTLVFTSTINVAWQGFGPTSSFVDSTHFRVPALIVNNHFQGLSRQAEASGIVTDLANNNLASLPTVNADLENDSGGSVVVSQP